MIVEEITGVAWNVEEVVAPNGVELKVLVLIDQQAGRVTRIPFDSAVAKEVAGRLSGLVVTRVMPADGPGMNGGGIPH